eukprot:2256409-Prymnesium_polylepis.1
MENACMHVRYTGDCMHGERRRVRGEEVRRGEEVGRGEEVRRGKEVRRGDPPPRTWPASSRKATTLRLSMTR